MNKRKQIAELKQRIDSAKYWVLHAQKRLDAAKEDVKGWKNNLKREQSDLADLKAQLRKLTP